MESGSNSCLLIPASNFLVLVGLITLILIRVFYVIYRSSRPHRATSQQQPLSTLIVMGSGGHTAEMINLLNVLQKNRFKPRYSIAAATDNMSLQKAQLLENPMLNEVIAVGWTFTVFLVFQGGVEEVGSAQFMQYRS